MHSVASALRAACACMSYEEEDTSALRAACAAAKAWLLSSKQKRIHACHMRRRIPQLYALLVLRPWLGLSLARPFASE